MQILEDGFPLPENDPQPALQATIANWWRQAWAAKQNAFDGADPAAAALRGMTQAERIAILQAGYARLRWLRTSVMAGGRGEAERSAHQFAFTGALLAGAYRRKIVFENEAELVAVVDAAGPVCYNRPVVAGPLQLVRDYVQQRAWTQPVADSLRSYGTELDGHTCSCCRDTRFAIKMFLWLDEWTPQPSGRSWGEWLRAQYLSLPEPEKTAWRRMFARFQHTILKRPGKEWIKHMQAGIAELGEARFTRTVGDWLAPLARGPAVTPLDSNLLRNLTWCCTLCPGRELDRAIAGVAKVAWPKKSGMDKLLHPIEQYMSQRPRNAAAPALEAIRVKRASEPAPKTPAELAAEFRLKSERKLLAQVDPAGRRVRRTGDAIEIDGDRGQYLFEISGGRITDRRTGEELEFEWTEQDTYMRWQIESALRMKLWIGVVAALLHEEACGIRLRLKSITVQ